MMSGGAFRIDRFEDITVANTHLLSKSPELAVESCSISLIKRPNILWIVIAECIHLLSAVMLGSYVYTEKI